MSADDTTQTVRETALRYTVTEAPWPDEPLVVERGGRPAAVIISLEEYRHFAAWRAERNARRTWVLEHDPRQRMSAAQWQAQFVGLDRFAAHFADVSDEELAAELAEATRAVRAGQAGSTLREQ
jgi:PHD/YefM family antitoxin component YafN of YafNO toxin-antitoxin module